MLLNKFNLAVAKFASKDKTRPALQNVHVTRDYVEATEGHVFIRVDVQHQIPSDEFPVIAGFNGGSVPTEEGGVLVNAVEFEKLSKRIPKNTKFLPVLQHVSIDAGSDENFVIAATTDLEQPVVSMLRKDDCTYPAVDQIFPVEAEELCSIQINAKYLKLLYDVVKGMNIDDRVKLTIYKDDSSSCGGTKSAIRFDCKSADTGQRASGLIMQLPHVDFAEE